MAFCVTNDDRYRYFIYKGQCYGNGTKVTFTNEFIQRYVYKGKRIWKYAWFGNRVSVNGKDMYFFSIDKTDWHFLYQNNIDPRSPRECCPFFLIDASLIDFAIEEITQPILVTLTPQEKKKDWECSKVMGMWIVYIAILIASLIFKEFYLIWIVASILFFSWRKGVLEE